MLYLFVKSSESNKLTSLRDKDFRLEEEIQSLTEVNLERIFNLDFVKREFSVQNFSIDTLAFDKEKKSFVLIEYKREKSFSVIDQGFSYLAAVLAHKSDLILEYNERKDTNLGRKDVDWSQTKVIFIAPSFTPYQEGAIAFQDLPIELWQITMFENNLVLYNEIKSMRTTESIKAVSSSKIVKAITEKVKPYSVKEHLERYSSPKTKKIFEIIDEAIRSLDNHIEVKPFKMSINYKINRRQFVALGVQKDDVRIYLIVNEKDFQDPENKTRDIKKIGTVTAGNKDFKIKDERDIKYAMALIVQAFEDLPVKG
ncbi:hypothetical protein KKC63_02970 [Patescibacteria group bacterium]|nr:hypothetical protein [Patescibacteria group bacterium]MBU4023229.1 hypothetical protein [Patescibacteria group bacterium]